MKKIYLIVLLLVGSFSAKSQVGMTVVSAPQLEGINATMASAQAGMQASLITIESMEKAREKFEKVSGWVQTMRSAKQMFVLIETISCALADFQFNIQFVEQYGRMYCGLSSEIQMVLHALEIVVDLTNFMLSGMQMAPSDRMAHFARVADKYMDITLQINNMNYDMLKIIQSEQAKKRFRDNIDIISKAERIIWG